MHVSKQKYTQVWHMSQSQLRWQHRSIKLRRLTALSITRSALMCSATAALCLLVLCRVGSALAVHPPASSLFAIETTVQSNQPLKIDEVITKAYEARGGEERMNAMKSIMMIGRITVQGVLEGRCTLYLKQPRSLRIESTVQGFTIIQGFDGITGTAWVQNPLVGALEPRKASANEAKQMSYQVDIFDDEFLNSKKGNKVQLLGKKNVEFVTKESIEGLKVYELKITKKNGDVSTVLLDAMTFLPLRHICKVPTSNGLAEMIVAPRSFRPVNGTFVPYAVEQTLGGKPYFKMVFENVVPNPPLADTLFTLPAGR